MQLLPLLVDRFPQYSRDYLYSRVLCGEVVLDGGVVRDPKMLTPRDSTVEFRERLYVSRGGAKLKHALTFFGLDVRGGVFLDAGCSTGGFTDCLLQSGAKLVHSVDVGYNQLAYSLRKDDRVVVHEQTNVMDISVLEPAPVGAVVDLSFRTLLGVVPHLQQLTAERWVVALVKPQFELRTPSSDFDGVVRNPELLLQTLKDVALDLADEGSFLQGATESPITGKRGNREFLYLFRDKPHEDILGIVESLSVVT